MKRGLARLVFTALFVLAATNVDAIVSFKLIELQGANIKWGSSVLGTPARVTVAFADEARATPDARNCRQIGPMSGLLGKADVSWPMFRTEVRAALDAWERVAGITFEMVDDANEADILIGAQTEPRGRAFVNVAHAAAKGQGAGILSQSIVCLNPEQPWKVGFDGRLEVYDLRYTMTHEIGHAIGLNHPGPTGQVMSFTYQEEFRDPQPGDIAGATMLYGPPIQR
jgi:hypothetical protein